MHGTVLPMRILKVFGAAATLVILIVLGNILFIKVAKAQVTSQQPIAFNHQIMVGAGINCLFCHTGAMKSPVAGIPSVAKCMGCHTIIAPDAPEIKKLAGYWQSQTSIPWEPVNTLPRFVYFSHQVHLAGGVNCERCHGDVGHMTVTKPVVAMNMGWCLNCHAQQANAAQLKDCAVCHK
jgi:hypothetical protein